MPPSDTGRCGSAGALKAPSTQSPVHSVGGPSRDDERFSQLDGLITCQPKLNEVFECRQETQAQQSRHPKISRLPTELLVRVFLICVPLRDAPDGDTSAPRGFAFGDLLNATHVCRLWRTTALGCPSLWSFVFFSRPNWTLEMLARSQSAPPTLRITEVGCTPRARTGGNAVHVPRRPPVAQRLEEMDDQYGIASGTASPSSRARGPAGQRSYPERDSDPDFPADAFRGQTPQLQSLRIRRCVLGWNAPILRGLTTLHVEGVPPAQRMAASQLLSILRSSPDLVSLSLNAAIPAISRPPSPSSAQVVHLARLSRPALAGSPAETCAILGRLSLPAGVSLNISHPSARWEHLAVSTALAFLASYVPGAAPANLQSLAFETDSLSPNVCGRRTRTMPSAALRLPERGGPHFSLLFLWTAASDEREQLAVQAPTLLSLRALRTRSVAQGCPLSAGAWLEAFRTAGGREHVALRMRPGAGGFVQSLVSVVPGDRADGADVGVGDGCGPRRRPSVGRHGPSRVFLPELRAIELVRVDFDDCDAEPAFAQTLQRNLAARRWPPRRRSSSGFANARMCTRSTSMC